MEIDWIFLSYSNGNWLNFVSSFTGNWLNFYLVPLEIDWILSNSIEKLFEFLSSGVVWAVGQGGASSKLTTHIFLESELEPSRL